MTESTGLGFRVLLVEDDPEYARFTQTALEQERFEVEWVADGRVAAKQLQNSEYHVVVSDLRMPGMNGAELLRYVRLLQESTAFLMLTGHNDVPTAVQAVRDGADEYLVKPVPPRALLLSILSAIERRAQITRGLRQVRAAERETGAWFLRTVHTLVNTLEAKDQYTRDHSKKVAVVAVKMALEVPGLTREQVREIRVGALLHDIGKVAVPLSILHKEGPLTADEWEVVKLHPVHGSRILEPIKRSYPEVQRIVRHEHERWDGRGYPDGLAAEEIPLGARLVMVADTYDAICSTRPYRKAMSKAEASKAIREGAGTQFDPDLVTVFERVLPELPLPRYD